MLTPSRCAARAISSLPLLALRPVALRRVLLRFRVLLAYLAAMKRTILLTLLLAGCSGSGLSTSSGPNGETIVGNDVSVQVTGAANPNAAFTLAQRYCRKNDRDARAVSQSGTTAAFDCVKAT